MTSSRRRLLSAMHLGGLTFREVCLRTWTKINEHEILTRAATISFYALAALVPFLALVIALSAWFLLSGTIFKHGRKTTDVLFIDASREFQDEKRQARLRSSDIDKIVATFAKYKSVPTYAYRATAKEIAGNDYNMNIPRYMETSEAEEEIDIIAVQREIDGLESDLAKTRAEIRKHLKELGL